MIEISNIEVMNFDNAIRGMRNPMNSWDKSDSFKDKDGTFRLGKRDYLLAMKLVNAGSDHRKFLRQIIVSMDICAPLYWWKEFDTYKVGTVANSCSTMHKIHEKDFTLADFSCEHLTGSERLVFESLIECINDNRGMFIATNDRQYWHKMIQLLPTSYNQLRTVTLNYEVLRNIYNARKSHKLTEWRELCAKFEDLPYCEFIID